MNRGVKVEHDRKYAATHFDIGVSHRFLGCFRGYMRFSTHSPECDLRNEHFQNAQIAGLGSVLLPGSDVRILKVFISRKKGNTPPPPNPADSDPRCKVGVTRACHRQCTPLTHPYALDSYPRRAACHRQCTPLTLVRTPLTKGACTIWPIGLGPQLAHWARVPLAHLAHLAHVPFGPYKPP